VIRYTYDYRGTKIIAHECEKRGYPHKTASGETQYDNTFFDTELEAWEALLRETEAGLSLDTSARKQARANLEKITQQLADTAERLIVVREGLEKARADQCLRPAQEEEREKR
jgi:hypothetical protein